MIALEVCIDADDLLALPADVAAAKAGGASRIELCGQMQHQGLTPSDAAMGIAREAFADVPGLLVMIRPRAGDFCYSASELTQMQDSIYRAAGQGADGIVLGVLDSHNRMDIKALSPLLALAQHLSLQVTFHRAFDAIENQFEALEQLIDLGVSRVLTAGTPWESGLGVIEGLPRLSALLTRAAGRIELVAGGGVGPDNVAHILSELGGSSHWSLHTYSAVLESSLRDSNFTEPNLQNSANAKSGPVSQARVAELVANIRAHSLLQVPQGRPFTC